jgi:spectinomycin phosphotransferase/16S rRNA (guanine(1405)-N(7))-methyltransferase
MKASLLPLLRSPVDGSELSLESAQEADGEIVAGTLVDGGGNRFPVADGVPLFAEEAGSDETFAFKWRKIGGSYGHEGETRRQRQQWYLDRFGYESRQALLDALDSKVVLDAGCGSGVDSAMFSESGATVVSVDLSREAALATYGHLGSLPNVHVLQGDINRLPFGPGTFDYVSSDQVLHHTPDTETAFAALVPLMKPGGRIAPDLADETIRSSLADHWAFDAEALEYEPVGFGAHHWRARGAGGDERFLTVHDLTAKRQDEHEPEDEVFERLVASFSAAAALAGAGLDFVLAPTPGGDGRIADRMDHRFTLAVHPYLVGRPAGPWGEFESAADRIAVLELVVAVHRASEVALPFARVDDLAVPHVEEIPLALDALGEPWTGGPYGERARRLLDERAHGLGRLLVAHDHLRVAVLPQLDRAVLTHGEPHAGNVLVADGRFLLVDWDTALVAPPERDLWQLDPGDGSVVEAYRQATGRRLSREALDLYRLWWDLTEVGQYLGEMRRPHPDTTDMAESWKNLQHFLQPEERWPDLVR